MSTGNRALHEIEQRGVLDCITRLTDPERRDLELSEIEQLSALMPEWTISTSTSEGRTSHVLKRYVSGFSSPGQLERAFDNAQSYVERQYGFDLQFGLETDEDDREFYQVTAVIESGGITARTFRVINAFDQQLAVHNAFGTTDF